MSFKDRPKDARAGRQKPSDASAKALSEKEIVDFPGDLGSRREPENPLRQESLDIAPDERAKAEVIEFLGNLKPRKPENPIRQEFLDSAPDNRTRAEWERLLSEYDELTYDRFFYQYEKQMHEMLRENPLWLLKRLHPRFKYGSAPGRGRGRQEYSTRVVEGYENQADLGPVKTVSAERVSSFSQPPSVITHRLFLSLRPPAADSSRHETIWAKVAYMMRFLWKLILPAIAIAALPAATYLPANSPDREQAATSQKELSGPIPGSSAGGPGCSTDLTGKGNQTLL